MKKKESNTPFSHNLPELDIIDLDAEPGFPEEESPQHNGMQGSEELSVTEEMQDTEEFQDAEELQSLDEVQKTETPQAVHDLRRDSNRRKDPVSEEEAQESGEHGVLRVLRVASHFIFLILVVVCVCLIVQRVRNYGVSIDLSDYAGKDTLEDVLDSIVPLIPEDGWEVEDDDGVTTIVFMGNNPFADDWDSEDNLVNMIAEMTGATVYNCSVEGSYLCAVGANLTHDPEPIDAFNFYWLTTAFCVRTNDYLFQNIFEQHADELPEHGIEAYNTLLSIDFETVDVIAIMYDASDYLAGHYIIDEDESTNIYRFTGNLNAGIELIQETYPNIRIIVMSPTYAYAVDEDGNYVSSDLYRYADDVLSSFVIQEATACYTHSVSFVDNLYGTIHEDIASDYLTDNLHLNVEGRKLVAERFVYALTLFD